MKTRLPAQAGSIGECLIFNGQYPMVNDQYSMFNAQPLPFS
jgi:hypothetical protein